MKKTSLIPIMFFLILFGAESIAQVLSPVWSYQLQPNSTRMEYGASPAIKDLGPLVNNEGGEPDNYMEVVTGSDEYNNLFPELNSYAYGIWRCFDAHGNLEWAVDTKSDEARTSVALADINYDLSTELAAGTTSGWCIEVMNKFGSWTPGVSDAAWTFPYEPQRNGSFMWHSSPAIGELITGVNHEGLEIIAGNNPLMSIWAFDGDNSDGIDDGITVDLSSWGYPGPTGTEGVDWDVLWVFQTGGSIISSPAAGDIDGDGSSEIICGSQDSLMYCLNGATGALKWSYKTGGMITGSAGLADFDNNGKLEIVFGSQDGLVYFIMGDLNGDGIINPSEVTSFTTGGPVYSSPAIADVNNDGNLEVIIGSDDFKLYCFSYSPATNSVSDEWSYLTGNIIHSSPAIANSGRSTLTIYSGSSDSVLYVLNGNGSLITAHPVNGQVVTSPSVADIDGDQKLEIAFTTWGDPDKFMVLRDQGSNVTAFSAPWPMFRHDARHTGLYNWVPPTLAEDVGVTDILEPKGSVLQGTVIHPRSIVHNFGDNTALNFTVTFEIRNESNVLIYTSVQTVTSLASHNSLEVSFTTLTADPGHFHTRSYVNLTGDQDDDDNVKNGSYLVVQSQWTMDFETDGAGFDVSLLPNGWEWGIPSSGPNAAHSGSKLWATNLSGDYGNSANWILSSQIFVARQTNPILSFWHWYNMEDNRDGGNLKVSADGINWTLIFPVGGYPGIATWDNVGIHDEPCYNGLSGGWQMTSFILPVLNGQQFSLSWCLGSDNMVTRPGWYIDDVMGFGFQPAVIASSSATPVLCHGGTSVVTVTATGGTPPLTGTGTFIVTAGTYTYTVTDAAGITGLTTIAVSEPDLLTVMASSSPTPCTGVTSTISAAPAGGTPPYLFLWSNGSTNQSISLALPGTYSVTTTDNNGCFANTGIITIQQPPTSITVAPSANPVSQGTIVIFTTTVANGGVTQSYQWKVNGINAGTNNPVYSYAPANGDAVSCVLTTSDGCIATSSVVVMVINGVPATIALQNITVFNGRTKCYSATQTITVAGSGTTFIVQAGGEATMIAGQNILYLPGTTVAPGGHMHGEISTDGQYCGAKSASFASTGEEESSNTPFLENIFFRIYPNPTTGNFTLEQTGGNGNGKVTVEIFNTMGERILSADLSGERKHEFMSEAMPAGFYLVRVAATGYTETFKLVKSR
ncbi:MAG: FG-GAP-like repeat-containing protein [Bacteroidetes bacterium]|nr:FG-GAP-like repeat-containing protein [Bacteroidota bacterium]